MNTLSPLKVHDYPVLKPFFSVQPYRLSTYSLSSIIAWSIPTLQAFYTIDGDTLIICYKSSTHPERNHLLLPLTKGSSLTAHYLHKIAVSLDIKQYWFVPENYLSTIDGIKNFFSIHEHPEYDDYIYLTTDLATLKGNKYTRQRNLIHQFQRNYHESGRVTVEPITQQNVPDCFDFLQKWCDLRHCNIAQNENLACERMATENALRYIEILEFKGIAIRIDGEVSAFGIASRLTDDMAVLNFEKAFPHIKGLYQYLDHECAKRLFSSYTYINKESDMNIPSLAHSKNSYKPVAKLKSYRLTILE